MQLIYSNFHRNLRLDSGSLVFIVRVRVCVSECNKLQLQLAANLIKINKSLKYFVIYWSLIKNTVYMFF